MFTLVQKAVGYFSGTTADSGLKSDKCERPKLEDFISVSGLEREEFEGVVTSASDRDIVINSDIYFSIPFNQSKYQFKVGDFVQGTAERKTKYEAWQAVSVSLRGQKEGWDTDEQTLTGEAIPCRDLDAGIPGILKNDLFSTDTNKQNHPKTVSSIPKQLHDSEIESQKTVIGKVRGIHADTVTLNEDTYFSLSGAESTFDLLEGDWVICKLDDDTSTALHHGNLPGFAKVTHVDPLRKKKIRGEVTHTYSTHNVINNEVFCSSKLAKEVSVRIGDAVIVEVIESDQGQFCWRALSLSYVVSPTIKELRSGIANLSKFKGLDREVKTTNLFEDKHCIVISHSLRFPQVFIGLQSQIDVFVKNTGKEAHSLWRVYFVSASQECQFSVVFNSCKGSDNDNPITIVPGASFTVKLTCTGKLLGLSKQLCIFDFGSFHIGRYVSASVKDQQIMCMAPVIPYSPHEKRKPSYIPPNDGRIVMGEKPYRSPAFLPVSLPVYHVPSELWTAIINEDNIVHIAPCLAQPINQENFQEKFSLLLHLEEIEMTLQMRQFDMTRTTFSSHGEFLSLTVPGLAEKRPSLMIGDTVIASNPCNLGGTEYEGYIHEVRHTQILLKFHRSFHNQYRGEDYAVRFNFNRTPLRRCHFALKFSMQQLSADVLFPTKLKVQLPQISYVDPEALSLNGKRNTSVDIQPRKLFNHQDNSCVDKLLENDVPDSVNCNVKENTDVNGKVECDNQVKSEINVIADEEQSEMNTNRTSYKCDKVIDEIKKVDSTENEYNSTSNDDKHNGNENCDNIRIKGDTKEDSPNSVKVISKRGNNVTPPRIAVVTRLFGVPSSGSSANSSMCCSDDESKSNTDLENEIKVKRNGSEKKMFREVGSKIEVDASIGNFRYKDGGSERTTSLFPGEEQHLAVESKIEQFSSQTLKISSNDLYHPIKEESQAEKFKTLLHHNAPNYNESNGINAGSKSSFYKVGPVAVDVTPVMKHSRKNDFSEPECLDFGSGPVKQKLKYTYRENAQNKKSLSSSQIQMKNERKETRLNVGEGSYCVPILPVKSSMERKIKSEQVPLLKWVNKELNIEQKLAVRRILEGSTRPLPYVIYGPPGTGKTVTLVEAVLQIFTLVHHSRLLIVTPSNSAADLVTQRLLMFGQLKKVDLVRLNAYQRKDESIPEDILSHCCNGEQLAVRVRQRVIVTTATTAGLLYTLCLQNGHFTHVFVDEAGQLTEPECLVALGLVNSASGQLVLAGDPQQLGPVVQSKLAKKYGLQESLLHRLCSSVLYQPEGKNETSAWIYEPRLVTQLVKNYRSHPDVFAVPSKLFYHESLQAHASIEIKEKLLSWEELPNSSCPLLFHGLVSDNLQEGDSPSWFNPTEAFQVVRYAKSLIHFGLEAVNIGIITPYRKQVQKIRKLLTTFGIEDGIKVGTVEEFQGQERIVIIISTVRSSEQLLEVDVQHSLGFVKCPRRFNVAITRAQSLLVVVGNPLLLTLDSCWLNFISFCIKKGAYRGPELNFDDQECFD